METKLRPLPYQIDINKHLLSLGVDIIIGAHPHVVQGHCVKHNKLIEDSLGNFLFHPCHYERGGNPVTKGVVNAKYLPLRIKFNHKTERLHPEPEKNVQ
ncbi:hypothetical protein pdam_00009687 [Pocillopora damicornis]|uniref:Capsule synthesis protein CapA domain-containing protein n=1 Tax=Pocillopora damicornis TaxID=46731 RepID=A0A3M6UAK3_POCDA|nr:hypothetical protein pdam_00009687 [Pocillopora damicornis]